MFEELDTVELTHDIEKYGLNEGDIGAVVNVYNDGNAYEVEFVAPNGRTIELLTLMPNDIRAYINRGEHIPRWLNAPISLGTVSGTNEENISRGVDTIFSIDELIVKTATPRSKTREEHYQTATL